jgi:hypothetical protein
VLPGADRKSLLIACHQRISVAARAGAVAANTAITIARNRTPRPLFGPGLIL